MSDPYENGLLDRDDPSHVRLVEHNYHQVAGIPRRMLWQPLSEVCGPLEIKWLSELREWPGRDCYGLCYVGRWDGLERRFQAITGALVRNFIDARLRPLESLLGDFEGALRDCTVLLLPHLGDEPGKRAKEIVPGVLVDRMSRGLLTVVAIESEKQFRQAYGPRALQLLQDSYLMLGEFMCR